jgi:hypothetical protein
MTEHDAFAALQAESARLVVLLESRGIEWRPHPSPASPALVPAPEPEPLRSSLSTAEKMAVFRRLFRGRTDVYPVRWDSHRASRASLSDQS